MKHVKLVIEVKVPNQYPVRVEQHRGSRRFRVVYGMEVHDDLGYSDTCDSLGKCIMHAAACAGNMMQDPPD